MVRVGMVSVGMVLVGIVRVEMVTCTPNTLSYFLWVASDLLQCTFWPQDLAIALFEKRAAAPASVPARSLQYIQAES